MQDSMVSSLSHRRNGNRRFATGEETGLQVFVYEHLHLQGVKKTTTVLNLILCVRLVLKILLENSLCILQGQSFGDLNPFRGQSET